MIEEKKKKKQQHRCHKRPYGEHVIPLSKFKASYDLVSGTYATDMAYSFQENKASILITLS
jgi:hypothetical protein